MADSEKVTAVADERRHVSNHEHFEQPAVAEMDNYHGLTLSTILVYLVTFSLDDGGYLLTLKALCLQYFAQMFNVVGSGAVSSPHPV